MSERFDADPNKTGGADNPHCSRYYLARGFVEIGETVVDAACGTGYGSNMISSVAGKVIGIDKDNTFSPKWNKDNVEFKQANLEDLEEFPECDVWVSFETIEHLKDPIAYMKKVTKATKRLIIMSSPDYPTADKHSFHLSDVLLKTYKEIMNNFPDWLPYHSFMQGYCWVGIYRRKI